MGRPAQALYRTRQFCLALRAAPLQDSEFAQIRAILTTEQVALFCRMQPSEQRHALQVLQTLQKQAEMDPDLAVAALLHDVGKSRAPLKIWERVLIVLARWIAPDRARAWGSGQPLGGFSQEPAGWKRAFIVAEQHPAWGAQMAAAVGVSPEAVALIRDHQLDTKTTPHDRETRLLHLLQAADTEN